MSWLKRMFRKTIKEYQIIIYYYSFKTVNYKKLSFCVDSDSLSNAFYAACECWDIHIKHCSIHYLGQNDEGVFEYEVVQIFKR